MWQNNNNNNCVRGGWEGDLRTWSHTCPTVSGGPIRKILRHIIRVAGRSFSVGSNHFPIRVKNQPVQWIRHRVTASNGKKRATVFFPKIKKFAKFISIFFSKGLLAVCHCQKTISSCIAFSCLGLHVRTMNNWFLLNCFIINWPSCRHLPLDFILAK